MPFEQLLEAWLAAQRIEIRIGFQPMLFLEAGMAVPIFRSSSKARSASPNWVHVQAAL